MRVNNLFQNIHHTKGWHAIQGQSYWVVRAQPSEYM